MMADNPMAQTALSTVLAPLLSPLVEVVVGMLVPDLVGVTIVVIFPTAEMDVVVLKAIVEEAPSVGMAVVMGVPSGLTVMVGPSKSTVVVGFAGASGLTVMTRSPEPTVVVGSVGAPGLLGSIGPSM